MKTIEYNWPELLREAQQAIQNDAQPSWRKLARELGVPKTTLRDGFLRYFRIEQVDNIPTARENNQSEPVFPDKKVPEDVSWRELVSVAQATQSIEEKLDDTQRIANVSIETDKPIAIMYTGDWHLGDLATNYTQWVKDIEYLLDTPNLYICAMGDEIQNMRAFKTLAAVLGQAISPKLQGALLRSIVNELTEKNKLLAKVGGNHDDEADERLFGERITRYLLDKTKAPIFKNRGLVNLTVGQQKYSLLLFHKSRFKSFLRATHGEKREYQLSFPADVICGAHDHEPAYELISTYTLAREAGYPIGGFSYLVKVGTYQTDSVYGWRYFSNGGIVFNPTIVFWPDQRKMQIFNAPQDAVTFMRALRNGDGTS